MTPERNEEVTRKERKVAKKAKRRERRRRRGRRRRERRAAEFMADGGSKWAICFYIPQFCIVSRFFC